MPLSRSARYPAVTSSPPVSTSGGRFCGCRYQARATSRSVTLPFPATTRPSATLASAASACSSHAPICAARAATMREARATAPPPITIERDPQVAVEYGVYSVSPCRTLIRSKSTPRISCATWAKVVSWP